MWHNSVFIFAYKDRVLIITMVVNATFLPYLKYITLQMIGLFNCVNVFILSVGLL